jgi:cation diffusion facilitator CzcD-associated flavoprotein CzcO
MAHDQAAEAAEAADATDGGGSRDPRFVVIGAGMSGILTAIKLTEAGLTDFTIYEKADRLGGTWRENTYPGIACDVPSHLYCYSFEPNPSWSHTFSPGPEIYAYFEGVARKHGVEEKIRFGEEVVACEWVDGRWQLATASGHRDEADVVIAATGVLHHPRIPEIDGLGSFAGAAFHSARWDHSVDLDGKRVGIIGTGSSGVQIVGAIVDQVAHLDLFQRTAQWVLPQDNTPYSEEQQEEFRRNPESMRELHDALAQLFAEGFGDAVVDADSEHMKMIEDACREHLESAVTDPALRERLRPDYRAACKRLVVSGDFYPAIQRPNAELVTDPIEQIEPGGVRTSDGVLHELDVLVLATGFEAHDFMRPMSIVGRDGTKLAEVWADRPTAYLSISIPDFPNLFMLNGPNGPVGNFSLIEVAELQLAYILQLVEQLRAGDTREISATHEVLAQFEVDRFEAAKHTIWSTGCRSWYLDDRGVPAVWPWPFQQFRERMAAPDLEAYELR